MVAVVDSMSPARGCTFMPPLVDVAPTKNRLLGAPVNSSGDPSLSATGKNNDDATKAGATFTTSVPAVRPDDSPDDLLPPNLHEPTLLQMLSFGPNPHRSNMW